MLGNSVNAAEFAISLLEPVTYIQEVSDGATAHDEAAHIPLVRGVVMLQLRKATRFRGDLELKFVGMKTWRDPRDSTDTITETFLKINTDISVRPPPSYDGIESIKYESAEFTLAPGHYTYPFDIPLPVSSPGNVGLRLGRLSYELHATMHRTGMMTRALHTSQRVIVMRLPALINTAFVGEASLLQHHVLESRSTDKWDYSLLVDVKHLIGEKPFGVKVNFEAKIPDVEIEGVEVIMEEKRIIYYPPHDGRGAQEAIQDRQKPLRRLHSSLEDTETDFDGNVIHGVQQLPLKLGNPGTKLATWTYTATYMAPTCHDGFHPTLDVAQFASVRHYLHIALHVATPEYLTTIRLNTPVHLLSSHMGGNGDILDGLEHLASEGGVDTPTDMAALSRATSRQGSPSHEVDGMGGLPLYEETQMRDEANASSQRLADRLRQHQGGAVSEELIRSSREHDKEWRGARAIAGSEVGCSIWEAKDGKLNYKGL